MVELSRQRALTLLLMLVLAAVLATGCAQKIDSTQAEVVRGYVSGLPGVLAAETLDGIKPYATSDQVDKMRLYVVMLTQQDHIRMQARLLSQEIVSTKTVSAQKATVVADEDWSLVSYSTETGDVTSRKEQRSKVTYTLYFVQGSWRVGDVVSK